MPNKREVLLQIDKRLTSQLLEIHDLQDRLNMAREAYASDQLMQLELDRLQVRINERRDMFRKLKGSLAMVR